MPKWLCICVKIWIWSIEMFLSCTSKLLKVQNSIFNLSFTKCFSMKWKKNEEENVQLTFVHFRYVCHSAIYCNFCSLSTRKLERERKSVDTQKCKIKKRTTRPKLANVWHIKAYIFLLCFSIFVFYAPLLRLQPHFFFFSLLFQIG